MALLDEFLILFKTQVQGNGLQKLNKQIGHTQKSLFSVGNLMRTFIGYDIYSAVRRVIPDMVNLSAQLGAMKSRFAAVSVSAKEGAKELDWVRETSKRLGLDFVKTADDYSIFFASVKNTMGGSKTREIFTQWAEAFRVLHIPQEQQGRVLYALREMSSKGMVYLQDLARQLGSAVPDAMNLAAKSMGYIGEDATARFRKDITAGNIEVKKFLTVFSSMINKTYVDSKKLAYAMTQVDAQLNIMKNTWTFFSEKLLNAGLQDDILRFLNGANKLLKVLDDNAVGIYKTLKLLSNIIMTIFVGKGIIGLGKFIIKMKELTKVALAYKAALATGRIAGIATAGGLSISSGLMAGLLAFITNPELWIPLAAIALVTALGFALKFVLKKFFPNIWNKIMMYWSQFKSILWILMDEIKGSPVFKALSKWFNQKDSGDITHKEFFPETRGPGAIEAEKQMKLTLHIPKVYSSDATRPMHYGQQRGGSSISNSRPISMNIVNNISANGATQEDVTRAIKEGNTDIIGKVMKSFKGAIVGGSRINASQPLLPLGSSLGGLT